MRPAVSSTRRPAVSQRHTLRIRTGSLHGDSSPTSPDLEDETPDSPESRRLRAIDVFVDMALEGHLSPTPDDVATRAGVSRATFFRYFATLDELRGEAATRVLERYPDLFTIPDLGVGSLDARIERFVRARVELHEQLHRLELLTRTHAAGDAGTAQFVDAVRQVFAEQAREHFRTEVAALGRAQGDDLVIAIAVLTSVESWQQFRRSHDRSPAQTRRSWRESLRRILTEAPGAGGAGV